MNKICPVVGVDVAKEFCYYCGLAPTGKVYLDSFKAFNDEKGILLALKKIEEMEKAFNRKPVIVLESTGHYSNRLVHFFSKKEFEVYLVNPLQSHSIKNSTIRKVKTDKMDAEELARLFFIKDLHRFKLSNEAIENLKILTRTASHLSEQRVAIVNQLVAAVEQVMPGYTKIFKNIASVTSLALLSHYSCPENFLNASKEDLVTLIKSTSRNSKEYAEKKYLLILKAAKEAMNIGVPLEAYYETIKIYTGNLLHINEQISRIDQKIKQLAIIIPELELLSSIPGIGPKLAPIILSEIGDISRFKNAKQLVAYCGIDPSVRQSGKFCATQNRFTKRGSPYIRKALYIASTVNIRKDKQGNLVNPVIHKYYQAKVETKSRKQALGAVMNKLVRIIFSCLKNNSSFKLITPEEQVAKFRSNFEVAA